MRRIVVVGAGCFGAWTAYHLARSGREVTLVDAYGPANSRASSGGETRLDPHGLRRRGDLHALVAASRSSSGRRWPSAARAQLFHQTGVLWMAREHDPLADGHAGDAASAPACRTNGCRARSSSRAGRRSTSGRSGWAILEPESGVLMARRAVRTLRRRPVSGGVRLRARVDSAAAPERRPPRRGRRRASGDALRRRRLRLRVRPVAADAVSRAARRADLPHPPGGPLLRLAGRRRAVRVGLAAGLDRFRRGDLRRPGHRRARLQDLARPARRGVRSRNRRARRRRDAARGTRLPRAPLSRARAARRSSRRGLPVREHVERRLPDRSPSRSRERLAGRRRLGPRLQARARGRRVRRAPDRRRSGDVDERFRLATKEKVQQRAVY